MISLNIHTTSVRDHFVQNGIRTEVSRYQFLSQFDF